MSFFCRFFSFGSCHRDSEPPQGVGWHLILPSRVDRSSPRPGVVFLASFCSLRARRFLARRCYPLSLSSTALDLSMFGFLACARPPPFGNNRFRFSLSFHDYVYCDDRRDIRTFQPRRARHLFGLCFLTTSCDFLGRPPSPLPFFF